MGKGGQRVKAVFWCLVWIGDGWRWTRYLDGGDLRRPMVKKEKPHKLVG